MIHYHIGLKIKKRRKKSTSTEGAYLVFKIISKQKNARIY